MAPLMIQLFPEGQRSRKNYVVSLIAAQKVFMMPVNILVFSPTFIQITRPTAISHAKKPRYLMFFF